MINVIHDALAISDINQGLEHINDVFAIEGSAARRLVSSDATIKLHPANRRQVIAVGREEQILEQVLCRFFCRRFTGTHHAINFNQRFQLVARRILR